MNSVKKSVHSDPKLTNKEDFNRAFRNGKRLRREGFTIIMSDNPVYTARVGFSISKKSVKSACKRNLIRRIFRELFRLSDKVREKNLDFVILANQNMSNWQKEDIKQACRKTWNSLLKKCS